MEKTYPIPTSFSANAWINSQQYETLYQKSINDNEGFWADQAGCIDWIKPFSTVKDVSFDREDLHIRWFEDGTLNVCANCVDRHLEEKADQVAIIWEGDDPGRDLKITYAELFEAVCRFANVLKAQGVQ